ncbi:bacteriohopanetetrol glucosamine biosynthesis glycosyltransferase HpnI [Lichenibacterium ramalinae]|uniref:bacteriohopanetetrol glucosamine biosynthesis glycosyltransferase HpnI n=1 Tax=Lichenibacterium ramalinae TaxID=2316527 RepID=UPI002479A75B|nr:bacteriohopanetetrol glucosamine biosynthesis glycosyltransferase HpnI [Lichenibacterium ramalinae]
MTLVTLLLLALAGAGCAYAVLAAWLVRRGIRLGAPVPPAPVGPAPGVSLLKPLYGDEPDLARNLRSFCRQDYDGPVQILFGVARADDAAVGTVERVLAEFPGRDVALVVDERRHGTNGKVSNLVNIAERARHPVLVFADSDMLVGPDYLARVVSALEAPGTGAVTCLYRGVAVPGVWSRLAVQWIDHHFLPNVVVGLALGLAKPCFGSTIALRRDTLTRIGGFAAFKDRLADDYAVGAAVRALGLAVAVPPDLVLGHTCTADSFGALLRQELRWSRTIRSVDPAGFAGSVVTHPVPLATLAALLSGFGPGAMAMLGLAVTSRLLLQIIVGRTLNTGTKSLILGPVRDYAAFLVFLLGFWPGSIDWRGHSFALHTDGSMTAPDKAGS